MSAIKKQRMDYDFDSFGKTALIPGIQFTLDRIQEMLDDMRASLGYAEGVRRGVHGGVIGRPRKERAASGWPSDPEERKIEHARRMAVRVARQAKADHPRDPNHPDHGQWLKTISNSQKKFWNKLTPKQRAERQRKMQEGRAARMERAA